MHPGDIALGSIEAGDETDFDRVAAGHKHDRSRRGRCLRGLSCGIAAGRDDDVHPTANQIGRQRRQSMVLTLRPAVLDRYIPTLDKGCFVKASMERGDNACRVAGPPAANEPDHRHRRLLCARRERPRRRAAEQRDELASPHSITSSARSHSGRPPNMYTTPAQLEAPRPTPPRYLV